MTGQDDGSRVVTWQAKAELVARGFPQDGVSCIWSPANGAYLLTHGDDPYVSGTLLGIVTAEDRQYRIEDLFRPEAGA